MCRWMWKQILGARPSYQDIKTVYTLGEVRDVAKLFLRAVSVEPSGARERPVPNKWALTLYSPSLCFSFSSTKQDHSKPSCPQNTSSWPLTGLLRLPNCPLVIRPDRHFWGTPCCGTSCEPSRDVNWSRGGWTLTPFLTPFLRALLLPFGLLSDVPKARKGSGRTELKQPIKNCHPLIRSPRLTQLARSLSPGDLSVL